MNILAISGSTKHSSTSHKILTYIKNKYSESMCIEIYAGIECLPHFNPDVDDDNLSKEVFELRDKISNADGILICTPEYVFSLPGSLKNAIEWCVSTTIFSKKPVATIVAAASGEMAFESLKLIMRTIESILPDESTLLIKGAKGKLNEEGEVNNQKTNIEIDILVKSFIRTINSEVTTPTKFL